MARLYNIDLSELSSDRYSPFSLLSPSPVFYYKDFKELFIVTAIKLSKYVEKKFINNNKIKNFNILPLAIDSDINFLLDYKTLKTSIELVYSNHKINKCRYFIDYLQFIQYKHLSLLNDLVY